MSIPEIYTDPVAAREHLERLLWPDGPMCPHCGVVNQATLMKGKSTRPGVYKCRACEHPFSVTVGTLFEDSKVPLHKWVYAMHLYTASKKGFSAHQHRTLKVTYKTAWFMAHRIRNAMAPAEPGPMGGEGQTIEADETFIGNVEGEGGGLGACDLIEYEGKKWLVPQWLVSLSETEKKPARIIPIDSLRHQILDPSGPYKADALVTDPLPKALFDAEIPQELATRFHVVENPDIVIPIGGVVH